MIREYAITLLRAIIAVRQIARYFSNSIHCVPWTWSATFRRQQNNSNTLEVGLILIENNVCGGIATTIYHALCGLTSLRSCTGYIDSKFDCLLYIVGFMSDGKCTMTAFRPVLSFFQSRYFVRRFSSSTFTNFHSLVKNVCALKWPIVRMHICQRTMTSLVALCWFCNRIASLGFLAAD